jgi:hypothetical protein
MSFICIFIHLSRITSTLVEMISKIKHKKNAQQLLIRLKHKNIENSTHISNVDINLLESLRYLKNADITQRKNRAYIAWKLLKMYLNNRNKQHWTWTENWINLTMKNNFQQLFLYNFWMLLFLYLHKGTSSVKKKNAYANFNSKNFILQATNIAWNKWLYSSNQS